MPTVMCSSDNPDGLDPALLDDGAALLHRDVGLWLDASSAGSWGVGTDVSAALSEWTRSQILDVPVHVLSETLYAWTHQDFEAELANIPVPTLVVHGVYLSHAQRYDHELMSFIAQMTRAVVG